MAADPPSSDAATAYVGRGWLDATVRKWAATGSSHLFLTGGPGTGKSAAVDHLWGRDPLPGTAVHRCRTASRSSCDPVRFAESLAEQFSTTVPGFAEALVRVARERPGQPGELRIEGTATAGTVHPHASVIGAQVSLSLSHVTADEAFEQLVCRPLELLAPAQRPVAVVDALDEALTHRGRRTIAELVLTGVDRLPLRFVLTSRHDARVTAAVRDLPDAVVVDLVDDAPDPGADLLAYARHRLRGTRGGAGPRHDEAARRLAAAGEGNYLYVFHLTQEVADGVRTVDELAASALPYGLEGVYREFVRREIRPVGSAGAEERWRTDFRPVLDLLVAAREDGFTAGRLADLLDRTEQEVLDTVRVLGQYLRGRGRRGPWTLFHRSFEEFLVSGDDPHLDAGEGHRRIADHAFSSWADAWDGCDDPYLLQHLTDHLLTAAESTAGSPTRSPIRSPIRGRTRGRTLQDRLYALATSPGYLAAQRAAAPGRELHLVTLSRALEASLAAHAYPRSVRVALALVRAGAEADEETPVQAALRRGAAAGVAKARTYPQDTALLWLLLIVAALGARTPGEVAAPLREIASGGLHVAGQRWAPAVAALLAPLLPRLTPEQSDAVLDVADDDLLGHLAAFALEESGPEAAVPPALRIRENVARARAVEGILTRAALAALTDPADTDPAGTDPGGLDRLGALIAAGHMPPPDDSQPWRSPLAEPDVADSVLLVHAARGELDARRAELADRTARSGGELSDAAVLLARIVQAARLGPAGTARARAAGRAALADPRWDIRGLLHHTTTMVRTGDRSAPALLDTLVKELPAYESDLHAGHVDGFHGWCGVGLRLAVVRLLAAAGQGDRARQEADRLRAGHPAEHVRALAWLARDETRPGPRTALVAAAREAADRIPHSLCAQAYLVLADVDHRRLADTLASTAGRRRHEPVVAGPARAALAWAAHVRGDRGRAEVLGAEAAAWFTALPRDRRRQQDADRLVKNLLRARLPAEAARVARTPTTSGEAAGLMNLGDVRSRLAAHAEHTELALLQEALGAAAPKDPARRLSPYEQALTMRVRRAGDDRQAFEESRAALRRTVQGTLGSLARLSEDIWVPGGADEEGAVWCLLQTIALGWPEGFAAASREWNRALERAVFSAVFEHPLGHRPREVELRDDADVQLRRGVQAAAELAEAFHDMGDDREAAARFSHAVDGAGELTNPGHRILAFTELAGTAARLGRYDDLRLLWPEAARTQGGSLAEVAETLAVTVLRGGPDAVSARRALEEIVGSPGLPHLDHVDLLATLAVITPDTEIEEQLLAAPARPGH
ncbi:hypothetical protein [Streptomyces erythrochromogenes]|uniref:hypothetical protein n=1 Tax=Streptomyces erythrochromogenes TaxID=285574 RepID=UPI0037D834E2